MLSSKAIASAFLVLLLWTSTLPVDHLRRDLVNEVVEVAEEEKVAVGVVMVGQEPRLDRVIGRVTTLEVVIGMVVPREEEEEDTAGEEAEAEAEVVVLGLVEVPVLGMGQEVALGMSLVAEWEVAVAEAEEEEVEVWDWVMEAALATEVAAALSMVAVVAVEVAAGEVVEGEEEATVLGMAQEVAPAMVRDMGLDTATVRAAMIIMNHELVSFYYLSRSLR